MNLSEADFEYIRRLVRRHAAIVLDGGKSYLAEARLEPLARQEGFASLALLVARLRCEQASALHRKVVEAMTTNETLFFRDFHPFEALRTTILPALIAQRASARRLNVWCAACSTGQEPYSVALLLREHFPDLGSWQLHLLATDLSGAVLARAQEGHYSQLEVNRGLPATLLVKYFEKTGKRWQLKPTVREMVTFEQLNLSHPWPSLPPMDIVFLRNVLIYFEVATRKAILGRVRQTMQPDGYLVLGASETPRPLDDSWVRVPPERAGVYQLRGH